MKIDEPFFGSAVCSRCEREWTVMLPDGCENSNELECPSCGEARGELWQYCCDKQMIRGCNGGYFCMTCKEWKA